MENFIAFLSRSEVLVAWLILNLFCVSRLASDLIIHNRQLPGIMKLVWVLTVLYSGPLGLAVYFSSGRAQISRDSLWRRSFRSVAHCYSGCGMGEIFGLTLAVGVMALDTVGVAVMTFISAYVFGFALTLWPLMAEGVDFREAFRDSFLSETPSITVMEVTAITIDLWLSAGAGVHEPLFWTSMMVSLSAGFLAAYPVNLALIHWGVKSGMGHPAGGESHCR